MSVAAQTRYKEEYIEAFERTKSILVPTVRNDTQDRGGSLVFLVSGSGGRSAVTRGPNGLIPPADNVQTQVTLTFNEDHDLRELTNFDIFRSQGDQIAMMRNESLGVIHRAQDKRILTILESATVTLGTVTVMTKQVANRITTILRNANVGEVDSGNIYCALTPAAWDEMTDITSFANADYTATKKVDDGIPSLGVWKNWMGVNWTAFTGLTGGGTATATCVAWHRDAAGYAMSTMGIDAMIGYDQKEHTSWRRASVFHGAVKLQNSGMLKFTHDDTALSS